MGGREGGGGWRGTKLAGHVPGSKGGLGARYASAPRLLPCDPRLAMGSPPSRRIFRMQWCELSLTNRYSPSVARPRGFLNMRSPSWYSIVSRSSPCPLKTLTRLLSLSATTTPPSGSATTCVGHRKPTRTATAGMGARTVGFGFG